jgi:hypothetical protein
MPSLVGIAVGAFADPDFPAPEQAVWAEAEHAWLGPSNKLPTHARNPIPNR